MPKDFLKLNDFTSNDIIAFLNRAAEIKNELKHGHQRQELLGKTLTMIFQKPSNRTRISFEVGAKQLGAHPIYVNGNEIQMGVRESIPDVARTLSRFTDMVMIRTFDHKELEEFANYASVPVINGLSDLCHPCQAMADAFTIWEDHGSLDNVTLTYIGDGNNVCYSLIQIADLLNWKMNVCAPKGYEPKCDAPFTLFHDPNEAVRGSDYIYTDVWTSMGQEDEQKKRVKDFAGYTITKALIKKANKEAKLMHCLPAHRGEEVTAEVFESDRSIVFDQAENRLHAQKGIMSILGEQK